MERGFVAGHRALLGALAAHSAEHAEALLLAGVPETPTGQAEGAVDGVRL
jgi:hypothetical protein